MASGSYAKITYIVLIHMSQGRTGLFCLLCHEKARFDPPLGESLLVKHKVEEKKEKE